MPFTHGSVLGIGVFLVWVRVNDLLLMLILQIVAVAFVQGFSGRFMKISTTIIQTSCVSDKCWIMSTGISVIMFLVGSFAVVPWCPVGGGNEYESWTILKISSLAIISGQNIATREIPLFQAVHEVLIGFWRSCAASLVVWWVVFILPPYSYVMLKMVLHWLTFLLCMFTLITLHTKPYICKKLVGWTVDSLLRLPFILMVAVCFPGTLPQDLLLQRVPLIFVSMMNRCHASNSPGRCTRKNIGWAKYPQSRVVSNPSYLSSSSCCHHRVGEFFCS